MKRSIQTVLLLLVLCGTSSAQTIYTVNSLDDNNDGTCDAAHCSLREAIESANVLAPAGVVNIRFDLAGEIVLNSALPEITHQDILLDGLSAPGAVCPSSPPFTLKIEIDGSNFSGHGFYLGGALATVRGFVIKNMGLAGILMAGNGSNLAECNYIGTTGGGTVAAGNQIGVEIHSPSNLVKNNLISGNERTGIEIDGILARNNEVKGNFIGMNDIFSAALSNETGIHITAPENIIGGMQAADRNRISGNTGAGILLASAFAQANLVVNNAIGINDYTNTALGNGTAGIHVLNAPDNVIGNEASSEMNVISGNADFGIHIEGSGSTSNEIRVNKIGTSNTGLTAVPNGLYGVFIDGARENVIGAAGSSIKNLISGNGLDGVFISGSASQVNRLVNNQIGLDKSGQSLGNGRHGVQVIEGILNVIGGSGAGDGNIISGNGDAGIILNTGNTFVQRNRIGTDPSGIVARPNSGQGIWIVEGKFNVIGGPSLSNVISGNGGDGVRIEDESNTVESNFIGTDHSGLAAIPNLSHGINIINARFNSVGGDEEEEGNIISGNGGDGIRIFGAASVTNNLENNLIGLNETGEVALPNDNGISIESAPANNLSFNFISGNLFAGVKITGALATENEIFDNVIGLGKVQGGDAEMIVANGHQGIRLSGGPLTKIARNVISGNGQSGIELIGANTTEVSITKNNIGTDSGGEVALGNGEHGILLNRVATILVGGSAVDGNLISGNLGDGIHDTGVHLNPGNTYSFNQIGTNWNTMSGLANQGNGIHIETRNNLAEHNFISGNALSGVFLEKDVLGTRLFSNFIGVGLYGRALGNGEHGVFSRQATKLALIGGETEGLGNTIAFNTLAGVRVDVHYTGDQSITGNSIYANGGLGIDIGPEGYTPNDPMDADTGPNELQNHPIVNSVVQTSPSESTVSIDLHSEPSSSYRIHLYASTAPDPSGFGEGEFLAGSFTMVTNPSGDAHFDLVFPSSYFDGGAWVSATATSNNGTGSTSEFSEAVRKTSTGSELNARIFLQGAYDAGSTTMRSDLSASDLLPHSQPFNGAPWNYSGTEQVSVFNGEEVDWVLIEVYEDIDNDPPFYRRAALVNQSGNIVDLDGVSTVDMSGIPEVFSNLPNSVYIAIRLRNHLDIFSANRVSIDPGVGLTDFSQNPALVHGTNAMTDLGGGRWGLWAGDGNADGSVSAFDFTNVWLSGNGGAPGYHMADFDLSGDVTAFDFLNAWLPANGQASQVP